MYCSAPPGPHGTTGSDDRPRVWRVDKPVYGMAQAGRRWQRSLFTWLTSYGFKACSADSCVFTLRVAGSPPHPALVFDVVIVGCYVDYLFVLHNNDDEPSLYTHSLPPTLAKGGILVTRGKYQTCSMSR